MDSGKWGSAGQGALSGAVSGALLGSKLSPGWGTAIGAGGGAVLGGLSGYFGSQPDKMGEAYTRTPEQQQALSALLQNLSQSQGNYQSAQNYLGRLLNRDPELYERFAAPYLQEFQSQIMPRISERFAGAGGGLGGGALSSSGFAQALGGAGANLQAQLAGIFSNLQRGAASDISSNYNQLANLGIGIQPFQPTYQPGTTGFGGQLASGMAESIGPYVGKMGLERLMSYINKEPPGQQLGFGQAGFYPTTGNYNPYTDVTT